VLQLLFISSIVIFNISQGSVATELRCVGKSDNDFITNVSLNPKMKDFFKISQHLAKLATNNVGGFFYRNIHMRFVESDSDLEMFYRYH